MYDQLKLSQHLYFNIYEQGASLKWLAEIYMY